MSKSNEVAVGTNDWGIAIKEDDASMAELQKSSFLPRLQFVTAMSKYVTMDPAIPVNNFALIASDEDYKDAGKTVDGMILSWRTKALDTRAGKSYYDHNSVEYIEIQERADIEPNSRCMYGPEYLMYFPEYNALATFFCGSKTLRYEVRKMQTLYKGGQPVTFFGKKIEPKSGDPYFAASVKACATPIAKPENMEDILKEITKFENPKSSQTDVTASAPEAKAATNRAR
jgi:hypothetical protein